MADQDPINPNNGSGPGDEPQIAGFRALVHRHDAVGVGVRERPDEHVVDDAEDRGRRADSKGERGDDSEGEALGVAYGAPAGASLARGDVDHARERWAGRGGSVVVAHIRTNFSAAPRVTVSLRPDCHSERSEESLASR